MKNTTIATALTTLGLGLGLGLTLNAQPGPRWAAGENAPDEFRGPGRQGPPPWAMRGGPAGNGPRWAPVDETAQPDQENQAVDRPEGPRRGLRGGPNGPGPRWMRPDTEPPVDQPDEADTPDRQGPPPWAQRGWQNRVNRQGPPFGVNRAQRGQGPQAFAGPGAARGQAMRQMMLRNRLQAAPRNGLNRQGPPPWVNRGGQFGPDRQGPPPWVNRGQGARGPQAFAGPGTARGQMMRQMLRDRQQDRPQMGRRAQAGICPVCGCDCNQDAVGQRGRGAGRPGNAARPGFQAGPRGPRGPMEQGAGRGMGVRQGRPGTPGAPGMNAPQDRPPHQLRGERGPRAMRGQAAEGAGRPTPPKPEAAE